MLHVDGTKLVDVDRCYRVLNIPANQGVHKQVNLQKLFHVYYLFFFFFCWFKLLIL